GGRLSLSHGVAGVARVLKCPLWASCSVRVEVRGDINSTLLQKPMDVSQFWRRYWIRKGLSNPLRLTDLPLVLSVWEYSITPTPPPIPDYLGNKQLSPSGITENRPLST